MTSKEGEVLEEGVEKLNTMTKNKQEENMKTPERSVEEIVEEFSKVFPATKMTTGTAFVANGEKVTDWLTQTLQTERQRCEEMVEAEEQIRKHYVNSL